MVATRMPTKAPPCAEATASSACCGSSFADRVTISTPPALTTVGVFGIVTGMSGCTLSIRGIHPGACVFRRPHSAGSTRSSAASRFPPLAKATVMYKSPSFVTYDTSVTVMSSCCFV